MSDGNRGMHLRQSMRRSMEIWMFHEIIKQQMEKRLAAGFKIKN